MKYQDFIIQAMYERIERNEANRQIGAFKIWVDGYMPPELAIPVTFDLGELSEDVGRLARRELSKTGMITLGRKLAAILLPTQSVDGTKSPRQFFAECRAQLGAEQGVRLRLRLPPEMAVYPWEFCYVDLLGGGSDMFGFLALDYRVALVRDQPLGPPPRVTAPKGDVHVLAALASPERQLPVLALQDEEQVLNDAFKEQKGLAPDIVSQATMGKLLDKLHDANIFHFAGHGRFMQQQSMKPGVLTGQGYLVMDDEDVKAEELGVCILGSNVALAFLGACQSGQNESISWWNGVSTALVKVGIPAVVAYQFTVTNACATAFSRAFYKALVGGLAVEEAVVAGRKAAYQEDSGGRDWGNAVLYLRAEHGRLFEGALDAGVREQARHDAVTMIQVGDSATYVAGDQIVITAEAAYNVAGLPNPYLGLRSFGYEDRAAYGGRKASIELGLEKLTNPAAPLSLLFVTGVSGSGKSSFVKAGLAPELEAYYAARSKTVRRAFFRPASNPLAMLADGLAQLGLPARSSAELKAMTPAGFNAYLQDNTPVGQVNVILIDQFEDVFISSDASEQAHLFALLTGLGPFDVVHSHLISAMRSDYLDDLFGSSRVLYDIACGGIELREVDDLAAAIRQPLEAAAKTDSRLAQKLIDPDLVERLVEDAGDKADFLPLVQVAMQDLWNGGEITLGRYHGLAGAISSLADEVYQFQDYDAAHPALPRPQEDQAELLNIFLDLVKAPLDDDSAAGRAHIMRRRRDKDSLLRAQKSPRRQLLIDDLIRAHLLSSSIERRDGTPVEMVDIIHDKLVEDWSFLQQAVQQQGERLRRRTRFEQLLREWQLNNEAPAYLLSGLRLEEARALSQENDVALQNSQAEVFLKNSKRQAEAERRKHVQRLTMFAASLAVLLIIAIGAAWAAYRQSQVSRSRELAAIALQQISTDPELAVLISLEGVKSAETLEAVDTLRQALETSQARMELHVNNSTVRRVHVSLDGTRLMTSSDDGSVKLWDLATGQVLAELEKRTILGARYGKAGPWVVLAGDDHKTAVLWDVEDKRALATFAGHTDDLLRAQIGASGRRVVTISSASVHVWDVATQQALAVLELPDVAFVNAIFSMDELRLATTSQDHIVRVWEIATGQMIAEMVGHAASVDSVQFGMYDKRLATGSDDHTARVWETATGKLLAELKGHSGSVNGVAFSPDGKLILTASDDGSARLWNVANQKTLKILRGTDGVIVAATFSPDGQWVATAGSDDLARVWNVATQKEVVSLRGHTDDLYDIKYFQDGRRIATASKDGTVRVWDALTIEGIPALIGHTNRVYTARYSSDGQRILTAGQDKKAILWDAVTGQALGIFSGHTGDVLDARFSPDESLVVTASQDETARVWQTATQKQVAVLEGHTHYVTVAQFSPDGGSLLTASLDGTAAMWDATTWQRRFTVEVKPWQITGGQFSPDGARVAVAVSDGTAHVYDAAGQEVLVLDGHPNKLNAVAFSPDGRRIATASNDATACLWDSATGEKLFTLRGHAGPVVGALFSPDGNKIATVSKDGTARLWSVGTGRVLAVLMGHADELLSADFSADGRWLATASGDATARVWDATNGKLAAVLHGHSGVVNSAMFSPDGKHVVTASWDDTARVHLIPLRDLLALSESRITHPLTCQERVQFLHENQVCPTPTLEATAVK